MGALGQRYATISFGTVLLSIYTMFGLGEYAHWYEQPLYFVVGVPWYGLTSILFYLIRPTLQVQENSVHQPATDGRAAIDQSQII